MRQVEEDGVQFSENVSLNCGTPHIFAMNNLDWKKKTLEVGSFNAKSVIVIEHRDNSSNQAAQCIMIPQKRVPQENYLMSLIQHFLRATLLRATLLPKKGKSLDHWKALRVWIV